MVKLRLARYGTVKRPFYRIVAADSRSKRDGEFLEILGTYDPQSLSVKSDSRAQHKFGIVNLKTDRISYWLGVGAQMSPTVKSILRRAKFFEKSAA